MSTQNMQANKASSNAWGVGLLLSIVAAICFIGMVAIYFDGLAFMVQWWSHDEYSHGWLIPPIAAFLVWQQRDELQKVSFSGSWLGVALLIIGVALYFLGELSSIYTVIQYAFIVALTGAVLAIVGRRPFALLWVALFVLLFMIPLPNFLYFNLSQKLQLLSSAIGVWVIRLFGISVFLEGNVIDLGSYKLQVVEACSGLRYLFPLMTLGFIVAIFFKAPMWKRVLVFLSTIPITVLMNSFRIGVIGVLVDRYGSAQAEGFLHDFEGWVIFMACFGLLFLEMLLLTRVSGDKRPFADIFALELPPPMPKDVKLTPRPVPLQGWVATAILCAAVIPAKMLPHRVEVISPRLTFAEFPMELPVGSGDGNPPALRAAPFSKGGEVDEEEKSPRADARPPLSKGADEVSPASANEPLSKGADSSEVGSTSESLPKGADSSEVASSEGKWVGQRDVMEQQYIDALKFTDYIMANYSKPGAGGVSMYVAYYQSQRKGESVHSPKGCLPGGGWVIKEFDQRAVSGVSVNGQPLRVNRTLIQQGDARQLVYYWFQEKGRVLTNEYLVKWYLFWDALTRNRSDGALVRLITSVPENEDIASADARLSAFAGDLVPALSKFVPD